MLPLIYPVSLRGWSQLALHKKAKEHPHIVHSHESLFDNVIRWGITWDAYPWSTVLINKKILNLCVNTKGKFIFTFPTN